MDRIYPILGLLLIVTAAAFLFLQPPVSDRERSAPLDPIGEIGKMQEDFGPIETDSEDKLEKEQRSNFASTTDSLVRIQSTTSSPESEVLEEIYVLENSFIRVEFTNRGGAISQVTLKKHKAVQGELRPYVFNEGSDLPALGISRLREDGSLEQYAPTYKLLRLENSAIEFHRELHSGIELFRRFELSQASEGVAPYILHHVSRFENRSGSIFNFDKIFVNVGTAPPTLSDPSGYILNFSYNHPEDFESINVSKFKGSRGFFGFFAKDPVSSTRDRVQTIWAATTNQFFTSILTPQNPGNGILAEPSFLSSEYERGPLRTGVTGNIEFDLPSIKPNSDLELNFQYYVGPKEYGRLSKLEQKQDLVMQFGFFGPIGKAMLHLMLWLHDWVGNYGLAIIMMTVIIRLLMWPLTAKATQTTKRMQQLQGPLQELREKYKDNQEKLNKEMMKMWKDHGVNPFAGCLPVFVQLPIFFALFQMLRSASELRFASFLWIRDLSMPDTIATIAGFPLNPLPLAMTASMYYLMRMTPMNMEPVQQKIYRLLPLVFIVFFYTFSAGLTLYWTMSNCFSILQQYLTNRKKDPEPPQTVTSPNPKKKGKRVKRRDG